MALFVVFILASAYVFYNFWSRMSSSMAMGLLIMLYLGVVGPVFRTFQRHQRLHELYLTGKISNVGPESSLNVILDVAERSMIDGLFFGLLSILAFLALLARFLYRSG